MAEPRSGPVFVAVGGGKGGVGKSFVASSLALALARGGGIRGRRVVAVDLDIGGSNLNLFFGEPGPRAEIGDFLEGRAPDLSAVTQPTRLANLRYVAGGFDLASAPDPLRQRKLELVGALVGLDADVVVLDLPAGSAPATLDFFFLGDHKIVVTSPDTAAFHDAYGFLKGYLLRRLLTEFRDREDVLSRTLEFYRGTGTEPDRTVTALVRTLRAEFPEAWPEIAGILQDDAPRLLLNRVRRRRERDWLDRFRLVVRKNLSLACPALGVVPEDRRVAAALRDGRPFLLEHPRHPISRRFDAWAERLAERP